MRKWWDQFTSIPRPLQLCSLLLTFLPGPDNRLTRRRIARWANLSLGNSQAFMYCNGQLKKWCSWGGSMILASMNTGVHMFEYFSVLTLRRIGAPVARRFPSYSHLVEAGIMTGREQARLEQMDRWVLTN